MINVTQRTDNHRSFAADKGPRQPCASTKAITRTASSPERSLFSRIASVGQILPKVNDTFSASKSESDGGPAHDYSIRHKRRTSTANDQDSAAVVNPTTIALSGTGTKGASPTLNPTM